jgi:archaemetzincin
LRKQRNRSLTVVEPAARTRPPRALGRRAVLRWAIGSGAAGAVWAVRSRAGAAGADRPEVLKVQPLGPVPRGELDLVEGALCGFFHFRIERLPVDSMPAAAYYLPRRRYRADLIIEALARQSPARILGVTALDISTTKDDHADWGILGLGAISGRACVISSFRCKRRASTATAPAIRLAKIAVHEVGHTLGLQHCPNVGCLMEDANGSVLTCDRDTDLCPSCRDRLVALGFTVRRPGFRWPAPR